MTIFVDETITGHVLRVRTTGNKGKLQLNDITLDQSYNYVNGGATSKAYWLAHANELVAVLTSLPG